ncbi:MAG: adenylate/guanylate cyclase domain-containing protein [Cyanobacteria bacterium J06635_15]
MAVFGAPVPHTLPEEIQQDAIAAVSASLAMYQALQTLNQEFTTAGLPTVRFGVGIHTGVVIGGTVGSRRRINYSLFGDTVNVAARLQDMTKTLTVSKPYPILLSEATYSHVSEFYQGQAMGELKLRGRANLMTVYSIVHELTKPTTLL